MSSKRNHQMAPAEISDKQCFLHTAKSRVNTAQVCSGGGTCNTARTSFSNSCPVCCNRQRVRCVRDTPAGLTQSLWLLQHSLEVLGEEREVCIYIAACTAGAHVDGQTTRGVLQTRREIQWWSWLPLLDSEYLWEKNHISYFNLTRTSVSRCWCQDGAWELPDFVLQGTFLIRRSCNFLKAVNCFCWKMPKLWASHF